MLWRKITCTMPLQSDFVDPVKCTYIKKLKCNANTFVGTDGKQQQNYNNCQLN